MTLDDLYTRHAHDSRARRLLRHYRHAYTALEQLAQHFRNEGDSWKANEVGVLTANLEQMAAAHVERETRTGTETHRP